MPQIYDMGLTALLPLRRKACWGIFHPKNPTASAGFEPANLGTKGQHATPRPSKPIINHPSDKIILVLIYKYTQFSCLPPISVQIAYDIFTPITCWECVATDILYWVPGWRSGNPAFKVELGNNHCRGSSRLVVKDVFIAFATTMYSMNTSLRATGGVHTACTLVSVAL